MAIGTKTNPDGWTLAGTSSSDQQNVTYPSTAKDLLLRFTASNSNLTWTYSSYHPVITIQNVNVAVIGSHFFSTTVFGYAFANINSTNRTINLRNYTFAGASDGLLSVYYR